MTEIKITPKYSEVKPSGHYVYIHRRATNGLEFYVGKGKNNRAWQKSTYARGIGWWLNCARKNGVIVEIVQDGMSEYDAFTLEMWLIAKLRREGVNLCNLTDGGEGATGCVSSNAIPISCSNGMDFKDAYAAAEWLVSSGFAGATHSHISASVRDRRTNAYGFTWWVTGDDPIEYKDNRGKSYISKRKPVSCSNGMKFDSVKSATEWVISWRGNAVQGGIAECCRGDTGSAYGFSWWWTGGEGKEYVPRYDRAAVSRGSGMFRDDGIYFFSGGEAARYMTKERGKPSSSGHIGRAANEGGSAYGYIWSRTEPKPSELDH